MSAPPPDELRQQLRHCVHTLNNVLGQVLGFGSLLVRDAGKAHGAGHLPKAVLDYAEEVMAAGLRGEQVARQLAEIVKSLPAPRAQDEPTAPAVANAPAAQRRVLVAGAQARAASALLPAFRAARWETDFHASSFDALRAFRAAPGTFDAVVTEQSFQEILGTELVAAVKALSPGTPCLILRSQDSGLDEMSARMAGADAAPRDDLVGAALVRLVAELVEKAQASA
jgi:CheY-like chemotaxis protein